MISPPSNGFSAGDFRADWKRTFCRVLWCYKGEPKVYRGEFETENLIVWRILKGSVTVRCQGITLCAESGPWVVLTRGSRFQEFSADAQVESVHLYVESPATVWTGPQAVKVQGSPLLEQACTHLRTTSRRWGVPEHRAIPQSHLSTDLAGYALLQQAAWRFFAVLITNLREAGVDLRPEPIADPRIAKSIAIIEGLPLSLAWNRDLVAQSTGISASQLDRIWQDERSQTPCQYWEQRRFQFAREKLENTHWSIKEIASELGFEQLAQFSNWFRRRQGASPRQYREWLTQ